MESVISMGKSQATQRGYFSHFKNISRMGYASKNPKLK